MAQIDDFVPPDRPPSVASNSSMVLRSQCRFTRSGLPCPVKTNSYARGVKRTRRSTTSNSFQNTSIMSSNGGINFASEFSDDDFGLIDGHGHGHSHSHGDNHHHHDHHHHDIDNDSIITPSITESDMDRLREVEEMDEEEDISSRNINHVHHIVNRVRRRGQPDRSSTTTTPATTQSKPHTTSTVQPNGSNYKYLLLFALILSFIIGYLNCSLFNLPSWPFTSSNSSLHFPSDRIASQYSSDKLNQEFLEQLNYLRNEIDGQKEKLTLLVGENARLRAAYADLLKKPCCKDDQLINHQAVQRLIDASLAKFDADKTGLPDFALESAGGTIVSIRCSETFRPEASEYRLMGVPVWRTGNSPRVVLHPGTLTGNCWAFHGSQGHLVIKLARKIVPTSFSYEHAPKSILPDRAIEASPKDFRVYGLINETDISGHLLGHYTYDINGSPLQTFPKQNPQKDLYQYIEVRILNNHGNPDYTCLYRFRVHGIIST